MTQAAALPDPDSQTGPGGLSVHLARTPREVEACQALRHRIFIGQQERGDDLDTDRFDAYCSHLLVREPQHGEVVACTRVLTDEQARRCGGFYSEEEFDLTAIHRLAGRFMEVGRTCVDPRYRHGGAIATLWSGLARLLTHHQCDYLMGCASIGLGDGGQRAAAVMRYLRACCLGPAQRRVTPRRPLPPARPAADELSSLLPPLLKAYLRLGAEIGGEPCWDPAFQVADCFVLLDSRRVSARYWRHFLQRNPEGGPVHETAEAHH